MFGYSEKAISPNKEFYITFAVQNDLIRAEDAGYDFTDYLWNAKLFKVVSCSSKEIEFIRILLVKRKTLGRRGEISTIAVAKHRN